MAEWRCILHVKNKHDEELHFKDITQENWIKIINIASQRKMQSKFNESKYFHTIEALPDTYSPDLKCHKKCYQNFTAMPTVKVKTPKPLDKEYLTKSSYLRSPSASDKFIKNKSTGVFKKKCIFCSHARPRRVKNKIDPLLKCRYDSVGKMVKEVAVKIKDDRMLALVGNIVFHEKEVHYHNSCKRNYYNKVKEPNNNNKPNSDKLFEKPYSQVFHTVHDLVFKERRAVYVSCLYDLFLSYVSEQSNENIQVVTPKKDIFLKHIIEKYPKIKTDTRTRKKGKFIFHEELISSDITQIVETVQGNEIEVITKAAHCLRSVINRVKQECMPLPAALNLQHIKEGQAEPPSILLTFLLGLYCGDKDKPTKKEKRNVYSTAYDIMYVVSNGNIKTPKHLQMGIGLKSLTGSKKVVTIANKLGHSIAYSQSCEYENEKGIEIQSRNSFTPDGLLRIAHLHSGLCWDNYNETPETLSGKNVVNDTVGIMYQNVTDMPVLDREVTSEFHGRRRRSILYTNNELEPYRLNPKANKFSYKAYTIVKPEDIRKYLLHDLLWTLCCHIKSATTPMWQAWNSLVYTDGLPQQKIGYLENIEHPSTQYNVIKLTLEKSLNVLEECGQDYLAVTYDLATAKLAIRIQEQESPRFNKLFVLLGNFHLEGSYFGALGYIIDCSGITDILVDKGLIGPASLKGFCQGKHYNRCIRLHPLMYSALISIHFDQFITDTNPLSDRILTLLEEFVVSGNQVESILNNEEFIRMIDRYEKYRNQTRNGEHGRTAEFWIKYTDWVQYFFFLKGE